MLPVWFLFAAMIGAKAPAPENANEYLVHTADPAVRRAGELLNRGEASQALGILEAALPRHPSDPGVLLLAGLAADRSDQLTVALGYWRQSLRLAPNAALRALLEDAERESAADFSWERLESEHIRLRYEGPAIPQDEAHAILAILEEDDRRISAQLGCSSSEPIVAILQSRQQYLRGASAAEWSGGHFDGRIHIAWTSGPEMRRALAHEMVHACLARIPSGSSPWPAWLQEGLAQKLSGDTISASDRERLRQLASDSAARRSRSRLVSPVPRASGGCVPCLARRRRCALR